MNKKLRGSLYLLSATIIWGSAFVAQRDGVAYIGPFTFQAIRCLMGALILLPLIWLADRKAPTGKGFWAGFADKALLKASGLCALFLTLAANLQMLGLVTVDAGKSGFLTAMYIVFVPVTSLLFGRKITAMVPISVAIAVFGFYFLSSTGSAGVGIGEVLLLGCAVAFALQILMVDRYAPKVDPLRLNCLQSLFCAAASGVMMLFTEQPTLSGIRESWWSLCFAGFLSMGIAYSLQNLGQRDLPPAPAALIMSLESVFAALAGALFLQETLTNRELLGCSLVFLAVILSQLPVPGKK